MRPSEKVLVIPDLQEPFAHRDALEFVRQVAKKEKPSVVVNIGDEADFHALSDWDHDPDGYSAGDELKECIRKLRYWYEEFPQMLVCTSNHTSRPFRKAFKHGIPRAFIRDYHDFLQAPKGWQWADDWEIDGVVYEHGEGFSGRDGAIKAALANMQPTVIGHIHSFAGIQWSANSKHLIFGFNVGCLIDRHQYAFKYGAKMKDKPILGCGIVDRGIPKFIPMLLGKDGRWIGKLNG